MRMTRRAPFVGAVLLLVWTLLVTVSCGDNGRATCPEEFAFCGERCVDTGTDEQHCGGCDQSCAAGEVCEAGTCEPGCPVDRLLCDGGCVDPQTDRAHCGASGDCLGPNSGQACAPAEQCIAGSCELVCPDDRIDCDGSCIDPQSDRQHCGARGDCLDANAGEVCAPAEQCIDGGCELVCPGAQIICGDGCIDPSTDKSFCGASGDCLGPNSGQACAPAEQCIDGGCELVCPGDQILCDDSCVDPQTDRLYCGASGDCLDANAGQACAPAEQCIDGSCELVCPGSQILCAGGCVDPLTDEAFCGAGGDCMDANAGQACAPAEQCIDGSCALVCPDDRVICEDSCIDPRTDRQHCGASGDCLDANAGQACAPAEQCIDGSCVLVCPGVQITCDGSCIDPSTDDFYCGASGDCLDANAGQACAPSEQCVDGLCELVCPDGQIVCDDHCIDPLTDGSYCGASGDCLGPSSGQTCAGPASSCPGDTGESCVYGNCEACPAGSQAYGFTGSLETLVLPDCVAQITVRAWGAQGGSSSNGSTGGMGAFVEGTVCVTPGTTLTILVGEQAAAAPYPCGGGGGSFVTIGDTPLFVAGGGGGGYHNWAPGGDALSLSVSGPGVGGAAYNDGGGGGGFSTDGAGTAGSGGLSFLNGGAGGVEYPVGNTNASAGGFGGGGGASESGTFNAGGGGGYDGGDAGNGNASTGGTSYVDSNATSTTFGPAVRSGHGRVEIDW